MKKGIVTNPAGGDVSNPTISSSRRGSFCPRPDNKRTNRFTEKSSIA